MRGFRRVRGRGVFVGLALTCCLAAHALASGVAFNIAAGAASSTLKQFAAQAHVQLLFDYQAVSQIKTPAVKGQLEPTEALKQLLEGSGFTFREVNDHTIAIVSLSSSGSTASPASSGVTPPEADDSSKKEAGKSSSQEFRVAQTAQGQNQGASSVGTPSSETSEDKKKELLQEVVVTGTHIRNSAPLSPLTVITSDDLSRDGYTRLDEAMAQLPQNFNGGVVSTTNALNGAGVGANNNEGYSSGINLRGLGAGTTLVLINGQRPPLGSYGTSVDISALPVSAIDRVEILTDGASATYGSDAIGGVVNIITKNDFSGVEASSRITGIADGKAPNYGAYLLGGHAWGTGNFVFDYDFESDHDLLARNRTWSQTESDPTDLLPGGQNSAAYGSLRQALSDPLQLNVSALYSHRLYENTVNMALIGNGLDTDTGSTQQVEVSVSLDYQLSSDWHAELSGQYGYYRIEDTQTLTNTPSSTVGSNSNSFKVPSGALRIDGTVLTLPGGDLKVATGAEARSEKFGDSSSTQLTRPASRSVVSEYGELLIPLVGRANAIPAVRSLNVDIAARTDHYTDFGSSTNPKISMQWGFNSDFTLSGSYGTSFRAPSLQDLYEPTYGYIFNESDPSSASGTRTTLLIDGGNPSLGPERSKATNFSITYQPQSITGLKEVISYFNINYTDKILRLVEQGYFANVITDANQLGQLVNLSPTQRQISAALASVSPGQLFDFSGTVAGIAAIADIGLENVARTEVQGFDSDFRYAYQLASNAHVYVDWTGTFFTHYRQAILSSASAVEISDTVYNPPRLRSKVDVGWQTRPGFGINGRVNYAGSYRNTLGSTSCTPAEPCSVPAWTTIDLAFSYASAPDLESWGSGLRVALNITNLFDRAPPILGGLSPPALPYDPTNANPLGRAFAVTVSKRW